MHLRRLQNADFKELTLANGYDLSDFQLIDGTDFAKIDLLRENQLVLMSSYWNDIIRSFESQIGHADHGKISKALYGKLGIRKCLVTWPNSLRG